MITMERGECRADLLADDAEQGWDRGSTMVTWAPCFRAAAAASQPIQPAPTITTWRRR